MLMTIEGVISTCYSHPIEKVVVPLARTSTALLCNGKLSWICKKFQHVSEMPYSLMMTLENLHKPFFLEGVYTLNRSMFK